MGLGALHPPSAQAEEKPKDKIVKELKQLYQMAGYVLVGKYVKDDKIDKPYVKPQTLYTFENCVHFKVEGWGSIKAESISTVGFYAYGTTHVMEKLEKGKRYIVFNSLDFGEVLASLPETSEWIELLKEWVKNGIYSEVERDELYAKAAWVITVDKPDKVCLESFPCQHSWIFPVIKVFKGEKVPDEISIGGIYKNHNDIPNSLKAIPSSSGNFILFIDDNLYYTSTASGWRYPRNDTSVLGVIPWSEEIERELKKK